MAESPTTDRPRGVTEETDARSPVTPDGAFEALASARRRVIVEELRERPDERVPVGWLVDALGAREAKPDTRRVRASLTTTHLETLDDCGLVEYDPEARTVRYVESALVDGLLNRASET